MMRDDLVSISDSSLWSVLPVIGGVLMVGMGLTLDLRRRNSMRSKCSFALDIKWRTWGWLVWSMTERGLTRVH